jgi:rubrerythrin
MHTRTSQQWWEDTLRNPEALVGWLQKQYHGEATAAIRIRNFSDKFCEKLTDLRTLGIIAGQEEKHAEWVGALLSARGVEPAILEKTERYWDVTLPGIEDFATGAGVAAHAEHMRLERIRVIAEHPETPEDIRAVFARILPEETFHERAFAEMAGDAALAATRSGHERGMEALSLVM